jgi:hypothetical protein
MKTMFPDSAHGGAVRTGQPAWRRALAVMLIALLSPVPALFAFWADASGDWLPDSWVDPASGHVFTLAELDAFSDDIDGDGLSNAQEMAIGTNPFSPDTDGDGISDLLDPLPLTASNLSPANGIVWGAIALDDADGDGIPNFLDDCPYGQYGAQLGTPDTDGDGIPDFIDPAPEDLYNTSPFNGLQWLGDALADADGDGVPNFHDWYPYDSALWDPQQDPDGDGLVKAKDPHPADPYNPSPVNGLNWGPDVYGDADGDGIPNFYDAYPYDSGNGYVPPEPDSDGDGIPDSSDPSPWDYDNFSAANGVSWQWDARGDADGDGISNFYDQFPYDYYNGNMPVFDQDGDGIPDAEDPAPSDSTNLSPINGGLWYTAALADADGDGNPNFTDPWPYDPTNGNLPPEWNSPTADTDADGIPNAQDPALADPMNFSIYNGTSWHADAVGDIDGDGIANFRDEHPYDYYNGGYAGPDSDGDGIPDSQDPYPSDPTNGAGGTGGGGDPQPEPDTDGDGRPDSQDPYPNDPYDNADFDHDGIPDVSDPARSDPNNLSPFNGLEWFDGVRGDGDGDGILNFWDLEPYGPTPVDTDGDGLLDSIDPAPADPYNYSSYNKTNWSADALGDTDGDGIPNFFDTWPYDSLNGTGDADMDGIPDAADPVPTDSFNYSPYNQWSWSGVSALGDADNDGILNYFDTYPDDPYNGLPPGQDADGDGIPNEQDPDPRKADNMSPYNGMNWWQSVFGDVDGDGTYNYWDYSPFADDLDRDGIRDDLDPAPTDGANYSEINQRAWYDGALNDNDLDGTPNFYDPDPDGGMPYEPSLGEIPSASASLLVILNDGYEELGEPPAPGVTPDRDMADAPLAIKAGPRAGKMAIGKLTALNLSLPAEYVDAGGSVTITQLDGADSVRLHAVQMAGAEGVAWQPVALGSAFVPPSDGIWTYWIEGVTEGDVSLNFHFPQKTYGGVDSEHPQGVMADSVDEQIDLMVCSAHLSVDRNRDGVISPGSYQDTTFEGRPFRFWVNNDSDSGEAGDAGTSDVPGTASVEGLNNGHIDGSRDLVDFFPVCLDIRGLTQLMPPGDGISYKLRHGTGALSFTQTALALSKSSDYLKEILPAEFGTDFSESASSAVTRRITPEGVELTPRFLLGIQSGGGGVILVEGHSATDSPLILSVEKEGVVVVELQLHISLCEVEQMYRHVDLTGLAKEYDGSAVIPPLAPRGTEMDNPSGLPDSETIDKYFVFVHGYSVSGYKARGWNAEVFKRLYALGSRARFIGVTWNGDTGLDYHKAVFHAFQAGDGLRAALGLPAGTDVTVAAHSLGNMLVSHAIQSGGFTPARYYMINAAVPMEAYDSSVLEQKGPGSAYEAMTESDWKGKDDRMFASNWYRLFDAAYDSRGKLAWNGVFSTVMSKTSTLNFYSQGEDVVENPKSSSSLIILDMIHNFDTERGAWGHQEMIKGGAGIASLAFGRVQGGWRRWDSREVDATTSDEELMTCPRFLPFLEGDLLSEDVATGSIKAADSKVLYDLLARGLPALSYAAAANPVPSLVAGGRNFDMEAQGRVSGVWPTDGHEGFRLGQWNHSDFKNVSLPYVARMYQAMIDKGNLKNSP